MQSINNIDNISDQSNNQNILYNSNNSLPNIKEKDDIIIIPKNILNNTQQNVINPNTQNNSNTLISAKDNIINNNINQINDINIYNVSINYPGYLPKSSYICNQHYISRNYIQNEIYPAIIFQQNECLNNYIPNIGNNPIINDTYNNISEPYNNMYSTNNISSNTNNNIDYNEEREKRLKYIFNPFNITVNNQLVNEIRNILVNPIVEKNDKNIIKLAKRHIKINNKFGKLNKRQRRHMPLSQICCTCPKSRCNNVVCPCFKKNKKCQNKCGCYKCRNKSNNYIKKNI